MGREAVKECFQDLAAMREDSISEEEKARLRSSLDSLYKVFNVDGDSVVDAAELASSLPVLCGGTSDEKARAAFALYDPDNTA